MVEESSLSSIIEEELSLQEEATLFPVLEDFEPEFNLADHSELSPPAGISPDSDAAPPCPSKADDDSTPIFKQNTIGVQRNGDGSKQGLLINLSNINIDQL